MQNFLVVSYDSDQQQFFYDSVGAESEDAACAFILKLRDYCQDADASTIEQVNQMAERLASGDVQGAENIAECQNCCHRTPESLLNPIKDYNERVEPGKTAPAGECPECGALASRIE